MEKQWQTYEKTTLVSEGKICIVVALLFISNLPKTGSNFDLIGEDITIEDLQHVQKSFAKKFVYFFSHN